MLSRRTFLNMAALAGVPVRSLNAASHNPLLLNPLTQPKFVVPLFVPPVIDATAGTPLTLGVSQFTQMLGLFSPATGTQLPTTVWGYEGCYPGPTIVARKDTPVSVVWRNDLHGKRHLLPVDKSVHWALSSGRHHEEDDYLGPVPIVTHLHGGHTPADSDGHPDAWFTPGYEMTGPKFNRTCVYENDQEAATLWYHDHALGITRLNVYAGLAGFYLLRDANEDALQLPAGRYEIGLAIQDRQFTADGQLYYPSEPPVPDAPSPSVSPEFFGDFILVNGRAWPYLNVEPRLYRFRMLNGSDSRFYALTLAPGQRFIQIGTDSGLLNSPVEVQELTLGPGERADVLLDFRGRAGQTIIMRNGGRTPFPKGAPADPRTVGQIMAFRVVEPLNSAAPMGTIPENLRPISGPIQPLVQSGPTRKLLLFEGTDEHGRLKPMLGTLDAGPLNWSDLPTETPKLGSTEIWDVHNATMDAHPIHLHLVSFQILGRQKFMGHGGLMAELLHAQRIGQMRPPEPNERGWKDTAIMYPGEVTRIIAHFDRRGDYVWHCHILSHEDHEMMRPLIVE